MEVLKCYDHRHLEFVALVFAMSSSLFGQTHGIVVKHVMSHDDYYHQHLAEHLDARGDLAPPWEEFPHYERYTICWRMGSGESWLGFVSVFLEQLSEDFDTRLAYLRRHAKAPYTWSNWAYGVLYPETSDEDEKEDANDNDEDGEIARRRTRERRVQLIEMGLVGSDVAYFTWRAKRESMHWPWDDSETPVDAARYWTRDLWYWSRHVEELRALHKFPSFDAPAEWEEIAEIVRTGRTKAVVPEEGLLSLSRGLAAGVVVAPWQIGLSPDDFEDTFDMDMGYVDAFRLWGMSVFDDQVMVDQYTQGTSMPKEWKDWAQEHLGVE
jgi:hypothetical protein